MANALLQKWIEHAERRALFWWQPKTLASTWEITCPR